MRPSLLAPARCRPLRGGNRRLAVVSPPPTARLPPARCRLTAGAPAHERPEPCRDGASRRQPRAKQCWPQPSSRPDGAAWSASRLRQAPPPRRKYQPARGRPAPPHRGRSLRPDAGCGSWWRRAPAAPAPNTSGPVHRAMLSSLRRPPEKSVSYTHLTLPTNTRA